MPYKTQMQQVASMSVLVTGARSRGVPVERSRDSRPATREDARDVRFCYSVNAESMEDACLHDSD